MKRGENKPPAPMTKRQLSRFQREQRNKRIVYGITASIAVLILGILLFGLWREFVHRGNEPIARVGDQEISTRSLAKMMGFYNSLYSVQTDQLQRFLTDNQAAAGTDENIQRQVDAALARLQQVQYMRTIASNTALDSLIEGELARQEGMRRGVELAREDRDRALVTMFSLDLDPPAAASEEGDAAERADTGPPTAEEVAAARETMAKVLDNGRIMSEPEFDYLILEPEAFKERVSSQLRAEVPAVAEQVRARHILFETAQQAEEVLAKLRADEVDFAAAAEEHSQDPGSRAEGGDLGWFPRGVMDPAFEMAAFTLEPGQLSEVVASNFGYHVILVEEKAAERELEPEMLSYLRDSAYYRWLSGQRSGEGSPVRYLVDSDKLRWARDNAPGVSAGAASG